MVKLFLIPLAILTLVIALHLEWGVYHFNVRKGVVDSVSWLRLNLPAFITQRVYVTGYGGIAYAECQRQMAFVDAHVRIGLPVATADTNEFAPHPGIYVICVAAGFTRPDGRGGIMLTW
jgi:hypothetical protein